ncbi:N-acetylgalactosamine-N,N'-diacetylbacillosaminyl-diphospho-undecaprenol 4-alpha-N-acetylgalactosaminyltransferase [Campylobacter hyointestinalis]|uniref:Glycosyl transferase n=1 Tax=Campylobacter hyointestinalis subsp. hyointestinalis TaxID=91352 RepID=A0A855N5P4_CAMHY|nr:glycosyltransferase [Campylobacter hyointestinalis]MBT0612528.1 glycosyltransferase [Campylobacter hyointestinalis subsp. hyointestinalis]MDY2999411.1 glycosyltransferase [Campylobacter hyointestinalis]PPB58506.1 glycosyl transferase [Campylobacter hyointestinalis subsp. hyointestinalis]PPB62875.1 glycosyl transferase [Campylobacter hyointestinalis subsp. hyointestinalis]PPB71359.1 glycosyl transferase [Campylobacter hyointestinalis subsp. hyointestinalis]
MKKMSVFIYSMAGGGAERVVSNLLTELVKKYEIHLILMNDRISYEIPSSVKLHFLERSKPFENGFLKLIKLPFLGLKYKKLCKNLGIDLHFVWMNRPCYVAGFARVFGDKKLLVMNECSTPSVLYKVPNLKSRISKTLLKWLYPKADFIYPNSQGNLDDLRDNFGINPTKMRVLYNALNLEEIKEKSKDEISQTKPFFLSVGRLDSGKNHELLIRAYANLKNCDKDLLILGDGLLKEHLQNVINELNLNGRVKLLGFDNNPYKYMSKCYAFVFVSLFEGFSNALIEALACSKLVISSEHKSGAKELLGDNKWGVLVPLNDEVATTKAMQKALDDPLWVKIYEKNAIIRATLFDKKEIAQRLTIELEDMYEKLG